MGSVKALAVHREPTDDERGLGIFEYSDAYSVFDRGPMPSAIPRKGASLCTMGATTFEAFEDADRILCRYCERDGTLSDAANPNGWRDNV